MITNSILSTIKSVSLPRILAMQGIFPTGQKDPNKTGTFIYSAPYRKDKHPSLSVFQHNGQWLYKDHATGEYGTNLDLLVRMGLFHDWKEAAVYIAVNYLGLNIKGMTDFRQEIHSTSPYSQPSIPSDNHSGFILSVEPIKGSRAEPYISTVRCIPIEIASRYLSFVKYNYPNRPTKKVLSAIGWKTIKGGWALRWATDNTDKDGKKIGKTFVGPSGPSFFQSDKENHSESCLVFEGIFDFLSFISMTGGKQVNDSFVANSTENVDKIINEIRKYDVVKCFFDNDNAGRKAFSKVSSYCSYAVDMSSAYVGFNDVNDYYLNLKI